MGTSISQPSRATGSYGKGWLELQRNISSGNINPEKALSNVTEAFKHEYGNGFIDVIVDQGVDLVESFVRNFQSTPNMCAEAEFLLKGRKLLAENKFNSFLAELALMKATSCACIENIEERKTAFHTAYLTGVVDYAVSRDLTEILGNAGMSNISKLDHYISEVKAKISELVSGKKNLKEILK